MLTPVFKSTDSAGFDAREGAATSGIEQTTAMNSPLGIAGLKTEVEENPPFNAKLHPPRRQQEQEPWKPDGVSCPGGPIRSRDRVHRRR